MDQQEAFRLLGRASAVDNRKVTQLAAIVWAETLPNMSYDEAADLMNEFRRDNPGVYLEPGHLQRQKRIRLARTREARGPHPLPPAGQRWAVDAIENDSEYSAPGGVLEASHDDAG